MTATSKAEALLPGATLGPDLTTAEAAARFDPDQPVIDLSSPKGRRIGRTIARGIGHMILRNLMPRLRGTIRAAAHDRVADIYQRSYAADVARFFDLYEEPGRKRAYRINGEAVVYSDMRHFRRFVAHRHADAVAALAPSSVCEVGFGSGEKLIYLASRLPAIRFAGYELTEAGTERAHLLQQMDLPATPYGRFLGIGPANMESVRRIDFRTGSAFDLPCADNTYDLVFTSSALEQMQDGLPKALSEIRRIARRHVLFFEPFRDFNNVYGRTYLWSMNYFRMASADLCNHGFRPLAMWRSYPVKPSFAFGLVLAEPV